MGISPGEKKQVVVIAGPSGSGKNSVIDGLIARCSKCERLVTATTRAPRAGEKNGVDYHFLSVQEFTDALSRGDILEHRFVEGLNTHYGVYKPDLESRLALGETVLAHLDIIGARYLKERYNATTIFILPGLFDVLEVRVRARNKTMSDAELAERMRIARLEIEQHAPHYDYRIVNKSGRLEETIDSVIAILEKEGYTLQ